MGIVTGPRKIIYEEGMKYSRQQLLMGTSKMCVRQRTAETAPQTKMEVWRDTFSFC